MNDFSVEDFSKSFFEELEEIENLKKEKENDDENEQVFLSDAKGNRVETIGFAVLVLLISLVLTIIILNQQEIEE